MRTDGSSEDQRIQKKTRWAFAVATLFGVGQLRPGPGTWASAAAVLVWMVWVWLTHPTPRVLLLALLGGIALAVLSGIPAATKVERESGRHDPGFVVIDEVAGQWTALLFAPTGWRFALLAFVLFRVMDITKPFPVRRLERLPLGWGIVFDDVAAGLYALVLASLIRRWM